MQNSHIGDDPICIGINAVGSKKYGSDETIQDKAIKENSCYEMINRMRKEERFLTVTYEDVFICPKQHKQCDCEADDDERHATAEEHSQKHKC